MLAILRGGGMSGGQQQEHRTVSKHLPIALLMVLVCLSSCKKTPPPPPPKSIVSVPANSFARIWMAPLEVGNDEISHMYALNEGLFVYTQGHKVYTVSRQGGSLQAVSQVT